MSTEETVVVFRNRPLRVAFGPKKEEVAGDWK